MSRWADRLETCLWHLSQTPTLKCFEIKALNGARKIMGCAEHAENSSEASRTFVRRTH